MTEIIMENFVEDRHHMMDMARAGHEIRDLNAFESRRLENESLLLDYLNVFKPIWLKSQLESFAGAPVQEFPDQVYLLHIEKELKNIVVE